MSTQSVVFGEAVVRRHRQLRAAVARPDLLAGHVQQRALHGADARAPHPRPAAARGVINSQARQRTASRTSSRRRCSSPALTSVVVAGIIFRLMFAETSTGPGEPGDRPGSARTRSAGCAPTSVASSRCWRWRCGGTRASTSCTSSPACSRSPTSYYEAASIDGAGKLRQFFSITLPNLKPTIVYVTTISIYGGLAMFLESFMLYAGNNSPEQPGPDGRRLPVPQGHRGERPRLRLRRGRRPARRDHGDQPHLPAPSPARSRRSLAMSAPTTATTPAPSADRTCAPRVSQAPAAPSGLFATIQGVFLVVIALIVAGAAGRDLRRHVPGRQRDHAQRPLARRRRRVVVASTTT